MFISVVLATGDVQLREPNVFTAFHVVTAPADASVADTAAALGALAGDLDDALDDDHVWISADGVRALAESQVGEDWEAQFAGMVGYAESKGWWRSDGMIRAHLERTEPNETTNEDGPA